MGGVLGGVWGRGCRALPGFQFELLSLLFKPLRGFGLPCDFTQDDPGRLIWADLQNLQQKIMTFSQIQPILIFVVHNFKEIVNGSMIALV